MIVLDASAAVELLLETAAGGRVRSALGPAEGALFAPYLLDVEAAQALRSLERGGLLARERAAAALRDLVDLPVQRMPHDVLLPRIWALRENATAYDAVYLALAEALEARVLTLDDRLARVPGFTERVDVA